MPTYEYECEGCGHKFEAFQSMSDAALKDCPACNTPRLHRLIGAGAGIIFKGSGFYETDYKRKNSPSSNTEGKSESKSESKPEAKSDSSAKAS